jgi:hypothetical protein
MTKVGRNAPCPCGSGRKYKQCCALKAAQTSQRRGRAGLLAVALLVVLFAGGVLWTAFGNDPDEDPSGRVWSVEHGHWHDTP